MEVLRDYALGIGAAAMICGITLGFANQSGMQPLLKLICGLVLTTVILDPILNFSEADLAALRKNFSQEGEQLAEEGQHLAEDSMEEIIIEQTETYILDKAYEMDLDLQVQVELDHGGLPVPCRVRIKGRVSPYDKKILTRFLRDNLGIEAENQEWI